MSVSLMCDWANNHKTLSYLTIIYLPWFCTKARLEGWVFCLVSHWLLSLSYLTMVAYNWEQRQWWNIYIGFNDMSDTSAGLVQCVLSIRISSICLSVCLSIYLSSDWDSLHRVSLFSIVWSELLTCQLDSKTVKALWSPPEMQIQTWQSIFLTAFYR